MNHETSDDPSDNRLEEPETLLFETSPYGTLDAIVEHDAKSVYFYLNGARPGQQNIFGTRACWVRNLDEAPYVINQDEMKEGIPPMMPRTHCIHHEPQPVFKPEHLSIIWLEEGNGAALMELDPITNDEKTIAVIPPWSGLEGFHGYAAECASESPLAWPMPENATLSKRLQNADDFWSSLGAKPEPFSELQPKLLQIYDQQLGTTESGELQRNYFAIDGGQFPPRGLVEYYSEKSNTENGTLIQATVAMSLCPQPAVEIYTNDPSLWRRIELAIRLTGDFSEEDRQRIGGQMSSIASFPWRNFTWLGPGHTCNFGDAISGYPFVLLVNDHRLAAEPEDVLPLPDFRGDPINLHWLIPITEDERKQLEEKSLTADDIVNSRQS